MSHAQDAPERLNSPWDFTAEGQFEKGLTSLDAGRHQEAVAAFTKAIGMNPGMTDAYLLRGIVYGEHLNKPDLAFNDFDKAIKLDPSNSNAYALRGATLTKMGKLDLAIEDFDQGLKLTPNDAYTYYSRGQAWKSKGDLDKAIKDTRMAISIESGNTDYQQALADLETLKAQTPTAAVRGGPVGCFIGESLAE
jgi:tetratricopeptide (TPR) repeat protein